LHQILLLDGYLSPISRSEIGDKYPSKKNPLPPSAAEFYIASAVDSLILLRKINESTADANDYLRLCKKSFYGASRQI
jgi:hypothetical protein